MFFLGILVSRVGIEPTTRRLRGSRRSKPIAADPGKSLKTGVGCFSVWPITAESCRVARNPLHNVAHGSSSGNWLAADYSRSRLRRGPEQPLATEIRSDLLMRNRPARLAVCEAPPDSLHDVQAVQHVVEAAIVRPAVEKRPNNIFGRHVNLREDALSIRPAISSATFVINPIRLIARQAQRGECAARLCDRIAQDRPARRLHALVGRRVRA